MQPFLTKNGIILTTLQKENCIFISHYLRLSNFTTKLFNNQYKYGL